MNAVVIGAIIAITASASTVSAVSGFGFALISVPLMAMAIGAKQAVVLSALVGWTSNLVLAWQFRAHIRWRLLRPLVLGALVGMPLGLLVLERLPARALRIAIAFVVVCATIVIWRGWRIRAATTTIESACGVLSGALNTSVGTAGPPLVMVLQARGLEPSEFRGTLSVQFLVLNVVSIALFGVRGQISGDLLLYAAMAIPAMGLGLWAGYGLAGRVTTAQFRQVVFVLLLCTSALSAGAAIW